MAKMEELGEFEITECIMDNPEYRMSPLVTRIEDEDPRDVFFPLKEIEFRYLEVRFK